MSIPKKYLTGILIGATGAVFGLLFILSLLGPEKPVTMADLKAASHSAQREGLSRIFVKGNLPEGNEVVFLQWAYQNFPQEVTGLARETSVRHPRLGRFLSETAHEEIRAGNAQNGIELITLARELYPQDPDVLGNAGIVLALSGNNQEARRLLEEAAIWRQRNPMHDYYLGGILLQSESVSDRTRGKQLLLQVIGLRSPRLLEPAALMLLANEQVPLLRGEILAIEEALRERPGFWTNRQRLTPDVLRILINRFIQVVPERALALTEVLMDASSLRPVDQLAIIALHQRFGKPEHSRRLLEAIPEPAVPPDLMDRWLGARMVQALLDENADGGIATAEILVERYNDSPLLEDYFQLALSRPTLTLESERQLLQLYLRIARASAANRLEALDRLFEIWPLRREQWVRFAVEELLPVNPVGTGAWLVARGHAGQVVAALTPADGTVDGLRPDRAVALFEALLDLGETTRAEAVLEIAARETAPTLIAYLRARLRFGQGDLPGAREQWNLAHQLATRGALFALIKNLGFLAITLEQPQNALRSLNAALSAGVPFSEQEASVLLNLTLQQGSTRETLQVAAFLKDRFPNNPDHINNFVYLSFLLDQELEANLATIQRLVREFPDRDEFLLTHVFGLIKSARAREASRLLQERQIDWQKTPARGRLIYALVLARNDQRTAASVLVQGIDASDFLPEERALLTGI